MEELKSMKTLLLFAIISTMSSGAIAKGINPVHQVCVTSDDCAAIIIGCGCIHNSTCAAPEDKAAGFIDGVGKKFVDQYKELSKCSASETQRCSMAGACPQRGEWVPKCEKKQCTVVFKPRS
jgi:hypothetical protein